eukprot:TRINITY_DN545_c1_g1_i7.p1 TRINITY_DN545_c1_g1~~TRINITY_DN545_c1_g1_i7.p1  ORF type:complete len:445 (+),score=145.93 TRINITY_DN545_c1_g1_i7:195-1529(+)
MAATSYNTMKETPRDKKAPFFQERDWEGRGFILGLLIDVGGATASQLFMLMPMVTNALSKDGNFLSCDDKLHPSLSGKLMGCEYLTSFCLGFPALCSTAIMLLIGRNLLQKRFYYGMLQAGGVVTFGQNNVLKEVIFVMIAVCYLHCIGYLSLVIWVAGKEDKFSLAGGKLTMGDSEWIMVGSCISLLLLPGALFLGFFYGAYDIEGTLVPLSQYVHDAQDAQERLKLDGNLSNLIVLEDEILRVVLREKKNELTQDEGDYEEKCRLLLTVYRQNEEDISQRQINAVGLFGSFWPGELLLRPAMTGEMSEYYQTMWFSVVGVCCVVFFILISFLSAMVGVDIWQIFHGKIQFTVATMVMLFHLIVVLSFLWPFIESLAWRWQHSPLATVVDAKNENLGSQSQMVRGIGEKAESAAKDAQEVDLEKLKDLEKAGADPKKDDKKSA